jgi:putative NIF3 family GTP cyclohydrolase 1 type 2
VGVDVYVTSDLRHHPVSELREQPGAPALVDVPHWAAEWTWLPVLADRLSDWLAARGSTVQVQVSTLVTDPWTSHLAWSR